MIVNLIGPGSFHKELNIPVQVAPEVILYDDRAYVLSPIGYHGPIYSNQTLYIVEQKRHEDKK